MKTQSAPADALSALRATEQVVPWVGTTVTTEAWSEVFCALGAALLAKQNAQALVKTQHAVVRDMGAWTRGAASRDPQ